MLMDPGMRAPEGTSGIHTLRQEGVWCIGEAEIR